MSLGKIEGKCYLGVVKDLQVLAFAKAQILIRSSIVVVERHKYLGVDIGCLVLRNLWNGSDLLLGLANWHCDLLHPSEDHGHSFVLRPASLVQCAFINIGLLGA